MDENILVFPNRIRFGVDSHGRLIEECLTISSAWSEVIVFRVTPSIEDTFSLPTTSGFLLPFQSLRIPVSSVQKVSPATFHATINIDIAAFDDDMDDEYDGDDTAAAAALFWMQKRPKYTTRIVTCECIKQGELDSDTDNLPSSRGQSSPPHSKVHPPRGHVLDLMVKNVSKNDPLTSGEKEELKAIRGLMTPEQWNSWLVYARTEKKSRQAESDTPRPPSAYKIANVANATPSSRVQSLIHAGVGGEKRSRTPSDSHRSDKPMSTTRAPKSPLAETHKAPLQRHELDEGIAFASNNVPPPPSEDRIEFSRTKSPPSMDKNRPASSSKLRAAPTRPSSAPRLRGRANATDPSGVVCGTPRRFDELKLNGLNKGTPSTRLAHSETQSYARPRSQSPDRGRGDGSRYGRDQDRHVNNLERSFGDTGLGNSHGSSGSSNSSGNSRFKPLDHRTTSTAAPAIQTPFFMDGPSPAPELRKHTTHYDVRPRPPKSDDPAKAFVHNKQVNQPLLGDPDNFRHQLYNHSHSSKSTLHPPEVVYKSPPQDLKPASHSHSQNNKITANKSHSNRTEDLFRSCNFIPDDCSTEYQDDSSMSPTAIAAAKASALRIDSAYAAAECMKASLKAEGNSDDSSKVATTMAMLDVMMKSLEKSKHSLNDILHSPDKGRESTINSSNSGENYSQQSEKDTHSDIKKHRSPIYHNDEGSMSDDSSEKYVYNDRHEKQRKSRKDEKSQGTKELETSGKSKKPSRNSYGSPSPNMSLLKTNELNGSMEDRWDNDDDVDINSIPFGGFSTSKRGYYDASPTRVFKSSLVDPFGATDFDNTASKSDFKELQRFGVKQSSPNADENDPLNNTTSSGNRNTTAAVVARFKKGKSGQPTQIETPRVWRVCLSQGPLLKAFEENPIRFDVENSTVDVVWRDSRAVMNSNTKGEYSYNAKASTLRRERFHFNESYAGPGGLGKLCAYARQRVKISLLTGRGLAFVCVAAGDNESLSSAQVEPPVSVVLGDCGGQGLISAVMDSLFRHVAPKGYPCKQTDQTLHRKYGGKNAPPVLASSAAITETPSEPILFSAVVISEGSIIDLLGPSGSLMYSSVGNRPGQYQRRKCKVHRRGNGSSYIAHMTRLQMHSVADFERVAGVLLGRRSALREMAPVMEEMLSSLPYADVAEGEMSVPDTPWLLSSKQEATLLFTASTKSHSGAMPSVHGQSTDLNYFFTCPCGDNWGLPGNELCLLSEGVSALPHTPAPSLMTAGVLPQLLLDPHAAPLDYINVAAVIRSKEDNSHSRHNSEKNIKGVQNALQSFRVVTSDT